MGEPTCPQSAWPAASLAAFQQQYKLAATFGQVEVYQRLNGH
jgi:hypothetical protein